MELPLAQSIIFSGKNLWNGELGRNPFQEAHVPTDSHDESHARQMNL